MAVGVGGKLCRRDILRPFPSHNFYVILPHNLIMNTCHLINIISKLESTINIHVYVPNNELWIGCECCVVGVSINFDLSIWSKHIYSGMLHVIILLI